MEFDYSQPVIVPGVITFPIFVFGDAEPQNPGADVIGIDASTVGQNTSPPPANIIYIGGSL